MRRVKVKIKRSIARQGCGFVDIEGKQEMFPRGQKGELVLDKEFELWETPFVRRKIESGELVMIAEVKPDSRDDKETLIKITVNGKAVDSMKVLTGLTEDELLELMDKSKKVQAATKDKKIKALEFDFEEIRIITK